MTSAFLALARATITVALEPFLEPVVWSPQFDPNTQVTLNAVITVHETIAPQMDHKGSYIPMSAYLNVPVGNYQLRDTFKFVNRATNELTTWRLVGAPILRLDDTMDIQVQAVVDIEKASEGYRGNRK